MFYILWETTNDILYYYTKQNYKSQSRKKEKNLQQSNFYQFRSPEGTRRKKNQFEEVNNIQLDTRNKSFYEKELKVKGEKHAITTK